MTNMVEHKAVLKHLSDLIGVEEKCAIRIAPKHDEWLKSLAELKRKTGEKFFVLIMGMFSSGKSSMINALLGEDLLPTGFLPETGVLTEIHYGENRKITMYPKKGAWEGGDDPFDLLNPSSDEIAKYSSIDNEAGLNCKDDSSNKIESKFKKMVIQWPLEILKDGVVLVDSPGLDDPWNNDYITKNYLPNADAVIYLMTSLQGYTGKDVEQLEELNELGLKNIIFGYTWFDQVLMTSTPAKLEKTQRVLTEQVEKHSELGKEAVHFLCSLDGLRAKMTGDQALAVRSGYDGLEKYLNKYLVENKGRDQVRVMSNMMINHANVMTKEAMILNQANKIDVEELEARIKAARKQLEIARMNTEAAKKAFTISIKNCIVPMRDMIEKFVSTMADNVDLEDYEPETELATGLGRLNPIGTKKKAKEYQEECMEEYSRRLNNVMNKWVTTELSPALVDKELKCVEDIQADLIHIAQQLEGVNTILAEGIVQGNGSGTASSIALGLSYALLTGDWYTGGMAGVYGSGVLAKRLAIQTGIGLATGALIASGVVVSIPVFVAAVIVGDIINILSSNTERQKEKIKKSVVKKSREGFQSDKDNQNKNIEALTANVEEHLNKVCRDMTDALEADLRQKEEMINAAIREASSGIEDKEALIKMRESAIKELEHVVKEVEAISAEYHVKNV